ncbi:sugar (pentulose or hexulose) kinase [Rathayibacter sp. PhB93]|uniref:xylulokinase n=1 Tax=unclassified Rathayibacter TaxID=2609250 RepID=UPI000F46701C|nr:MULTISPECIES: FGGY-family carbohydrate kinase [unclassified Rathayibacter]ROQ04450.1 sugar (pentulose or hexulose) kinase [Rathayibacter sp. PhB93]TDQ13288.1 sugar (pentulose or hexulose) kinase [Rathayibacter sp. PhB1]
MDQRRPPAEAITSGATALGIELGSTRIKACLVDAADPSVVLAVGSHEWENQLVDRRWTYSLDAVHEGLQAAYADLVADAEKRHSARLTTVGALGVSAMMHGYLAFDEAGELLVPFRTWRNTSTGPASAELTELFGANIPLRWSLAHLHQAVLDSEPHVEKIDFLTTLAGYVHWRLTGEKVLGVGDASGMVPTDPATRDYDETVLERYDARVAGTLPPLRELLPAVLPAGAAAGELTAEGALLLDPTGALQAGVPFCPPEGDAGTGMVATNSVAPRTGNVSAGTSIFAMVVLERPLESVHHELDLVATPAGDLVAMVHCNNGASELATWVGLFSRFAAASGGPSDSDAVYGTLFAEALAGEADAGGLLAYNHLAGEPIAGLVEGRPLVVRTPDSRLTLANFMRAQLYGVFGTLALGMRVLAGEGVVIDEMFAHGGMFRTAGVAQRFLAGALDAPVSVAATASEGGPWGMAVLAAFRLQEGTTLDSYLTEQVFGDAGFETVAPDGADVAGFTAYLERYRAGLAVEQTAVDTLTTQGDTA